MAVAIVRRACHTLDVPCCERLDKDEEHGQPDQGDGAHKPAFLLRAHRRGEQLHADRDEYPLKDVDDEREKVQTGALGCEFVDGGLLGGLHEALIEQRPDLRPQFQFDGRHLLLRSSARGGDR